VATSATQTSSWSLLEFFSIKEAVAGSMAAAAARLLSGLVLAPDTVPCYMVVFLLHVPAR
jgi:hypothetical protein